MSAKPETEAAKLDETPPVSLWWRRRCNDQTQTELLSIYPSRLMM
jgi:hypothetical protein